MKSANGDLGSAFTTKSQSKLNNAKQCLEAQNAIGK